VIARLSWGRTKAEAYDAYLAYLEESGVAELHATPGNRGVLVLGRLYGAEAEFRSHPSRGQRFIEVGARSFRKQRALEILSTSLEPAPPLRGVVQTGPKPLKPCVDVLTLEEGR
jgi:hypothetical protein